MGSHHKEEADNTLPRFSFDFCLSVLLFLQPSLTLILSLGFLLLPAFLNPLQTGLWAPSFTGNATAEMSGDLLVVDEPQQVLIPNFPDVSASFVAIGHWPF